MEQDSSAGSLHHLRSLEWAFHQCINSAYVDYTTQQSPLDRSQKCRFALEEIPLKIDEAARTLGESGQSFNGLNVDSEMDNLDSLQVSFNKLSTIWHLLEILAYSPTQQLSSDFTVWLKSLARFDIPSADNFELDRSAEHHPQYWDTMVALVLRGRLTEVSELLCLHSEIAVVVQNSSSFSTQPYVTGVDRSQVLLLLELLDAHPYSKAVELGNAQQHAHALRLWQDRVRGLHESLSAGEGTLLRRIPTLDIVLRVLLGEEALLTHQASRARHSSWATLALAQLYYVYAPPLSRDNILEVVERSLQAVEGGSSLSESDVLYLAVLRKALRGSVVEALVALYRLAQRECLGMVTATTLRRDQRLATTAFLQGVLHLTLSLVGSERHDELLQPLIDAPQASGSLTGSKRTRPATGAAVGLNLQQLLAQELAQALNALQFPPQTVVDYVRLVGRPLAGELIITLLTHRTYVSDRAARQAAQILHGLGLVRASQEVLTLRGMFWLQGRSLAYVPSPLVSSTGSGKDTSPTPLKLQTGFASAAAFFAQAQHWRKTQRIVQLIFQQLTWTVAQCHNLFPELSLPPTDNAQDLLTHHQQRLVSQQRAQQQQLIGQSSVTDTIQRLVLAAEEVERVLAAILGDVSLLSESSTGSCVEQDLLCEVAALQRYHAAVLACLRFHAASGSSEIHGSSLTNIHPVSSSSGQVQQMDVSEDADSEAAQVLVNTVPHLRALRVAALQLVSLLTGIEDEQLGSHTGSSAWNTPYLLRFRLHTLQFSASLHALVTQTELAQSLSVTFLAHAEQQKDLQQLQSSVSSQWTHGIYSQAQTEMMLQQIYHQVESAILQEVIAVRLGVDGAARETLQRDILQPLQLQLTGLWTTATHVASLQVVTQRRQSTTAGLSSTLPSVVPLQLSATSTSSRLRSNDFRRSGAAETASTTEAIGRYRRLVLPGAVNNIE